MGCNTSSTPPTVSPGRAEGFWRPSRTARIRPRRSCRSAGRFHDRLAVEIARVARAGAVLPGRLPLSSGARTRHGPDHADRIRIPREYRYEQVSLLSLSSGDHTCIQELIRSLAAEYTGRRVSLSLPFCARTALTRQSSPRSRACGRPASPSPPEAGRAAAPHHQQRHLRPGPALADRPRVRRGVEPRQALLHDRPPSRTDADRDAIPELALAVVRTAGKRATPGEPEPQRVALVPKPEHSVLVGTDDRARGLRADRVVDPRPPARAERAG